MLASIADPRQGKRAEDLSRCLELGPWVKKTEVAIRESVERDE
jgi:hypothetical protein